MSMKVLKDKNAGDTIVEVLISIAVVSMVLVGAFTSIRRSNNAIRTGHERAEALKVAETQIEYIKSNSATLYSLGPTCFDISGAMLSSPCYISPAGGVSYKIEIGHTPNTKDYLVTVSWDGLSGITNMEQIGYRTR